MAPRSQKRSIEYPNNCPNHIIRAVEAAIKDFKRTNPLQVYISNHWNNYNHLRLVFQGWVNKALSPHWVSDKVFDDEALMVRLWDKGEQKLIELRVTNHLLNIHRNQSMTLAQRSALEKVQSQIAESKPGIDIVNARRKTAVFLRDIMKTHFVHTLEERIVGFHTATSKNHNGYLVFATTASGKTEIAAYAEKYSKVRKRVTRDGWRSHTRARTISHLLNILVKE